MSKLEFQPFDSADFGSKLTKALPKYSVRKKLFRDLFIVRKSFWLSFTSIVTLNADPKKGTINVKTSYNSRYLYLILVFPIGIYILLRKNKIFKLKQEVIDAVNSILVKK